MDPIKNIEDAKAQRDLGILGLRIFKGALSDGATTEEAIAVTIAFYAGMALGASDNDE